jgi:hypothetical protein
MLEAVHSRSPEAALRLILKTDPDLLEERVFYTGFLASAFLSPGSVESLINWVGRCIRFWEESRVSLIADGLSGAPFCPQAGLDFGRAKLYPTKLPLCSSLPSSQQPARRLTPPRSLAENKLLLAQLRGCCPKEYPGCACEAPPFLQQPGADDMARIEEDRPRLFDLVLAVWRCVHEELGRGNASQLWDESFRLICDVLNAEDVEFYLRMDRLYLGYDIRTLDLFTQSWLTLDAGGLTSLLQFIGAFEALTLGSRRQMREALRGLPGLDPDVPAGETDRQKLSYFDYTDRWERARLNRAVDRCTRQAMDEIAFWSLYRQRVAKALATAFRKGPATIARGDPQEAPATGPGSPSVPLGDARLLDELAARMHQSGRGSAFPAKAHCFIQCGVVWYLSDKSGRGVFLSDTAGLHHIARLLKTPFHQMRVLDLMVGPEKPRTASRGTEPYRTMSKAELEEEGLSVTSLGREGSREQFRRAKEVLDRLEDLAKQRKEAEEKNDIGRQAKLDEEYEATKAEAEAVDASGASNKARKAVGIAIRRALDQLKTKLPSLAKHLREAIHTGFSCSYEPKHLPDWQF